MRVALIADVHGNLAALEAVLRNLAVAAPDLTLCLGDLVDGFGHPRECVELLRASPGLVAILGNAEWRVREWPTSAATLRSGAELAFAWLLDELGPENRAYLASLSGTTELPAANGATGLLAFHGLPADPFVGIRPPPEEWPARWREARLNFIERDEVHARQALGEIAARPDVPAWLAAGHTHVRMLRRWPTSAQPRLTIVNPGAVCFGGAFSGGRFDAQYALLDGEPAGWRVTWCDVDYDKAAAADSLRRVPGVSQFMLDIGTRLRAEG